MGYLSESQMVKVEGQDSESFHFSEEETAVQMEWDVSKA